MIQVRLLNSAVVLICLCACASSGGPQSTAVNTQSPTGSDRGCVLEVLPSAFTSADAVVDTSTIMAALRIIPLREAVISVVATDLDNKVHVRPAQDVNDPVIDSLATLIEAHVRSVTAVDVPWGVRLAVTTGPHPALALSPSEYCPPTSSRSTANANAIGVVTVDNGDDLRRAGPFVVRMWITPRGNVARATLLQQSGSTTQDRMALTAARLRQFAPASLDGVPISGVYDFHSSRN